MVGTCSVDNPISGIRPEHPEFSRIVARTVHFLVVDTVVPHVAVLSLPLVTRKRCKVQAQPAGKRCGHQQMMIPSKHPEIIINCNRKTGNLCGVCLCGLSWTTPHY